MLGRTRPTLMADTAALPEHPSIWMRMFGLGGRQLRGEQSDAKKKN